MVDSDVGCGPLYACYLAARRGDVAAMRSAWRSVEAEALSQGLPVEDALAEAVTDGDPEQAADVLEDAVFATEPAPELDGRLATGLGRVLWTFGYVAAFVLFFRAHSKEAIVERLRWAYRTVGVDVRALESVGDTERTVFRCPYRTVGAEWVGQRRVCHDVLDRVDDGYVSYLDRHREVTYDRPRPCAGGACCYSELSAR